jgi:hypothetical protein
MTLDELRNGGERIRLFLSEKLQLSLDYDQPTVEWLDGYIERNRHVFSEDKKHGWALAFGYILGEAIVRVFGGTWVRDEEFVHEWVVELPAEIGKANPIGKVYKHLSDPTDSVLGFFRITGMAIERGGFDKLGQTHSPES